MSGLFAKAVKAVAALVVLGICGVSTAQAQNGGPGTGSGHSPQWSGAPVACLPSRAQQWDASIPQQPCHCPPKSYCPSNDTNLQLENIEFHITINAHGGTVSTVIKGTELDPDSIPGGNANAIFKMTQAEIYALLRDKILEKTGFDVDALPRCQGCTMSVQLLITDMPVGFEDWINDSLKLPILLASRCCESICPPGMTPTLTKITVQKPQDPDEGIQMSPEEIGDLVGELRELRADLQAAGGLNAQVTATLNLINALEDYLDGVPTDVALLEDLLGELDDFNEIINRPVVPNSIKNEYEETLGKTEALALQVSQQIELLTGEPEMIEVDALTCTAVKNFPREGCLVAGTQVTLADGSKKAIEALTLDDKVKGNHGAAKIIALSKFTQRTEEMYSINGGKAFFTIEHPVLTPKGWKSVNADVTKLKHGGGTTLAGTLRVGDYILLEGGKELRVESIEKVDVPGGVPAYNLSVEGDGSFIANGFIMKGFKQMQMHY